MRHPEPQLTLEVLANEFASSGYEWQPASYFTDHGVVVYLAQDENYRAGEIRVIEKAVYLFRRDGAWCAVFSVHGGPHWNAHSADLDGLRDLALEALRLNDVPPSSRWQADE